MRHEYVNIQPSRPENSRLRRRKGGSNTHATPLHPQLPRPSDPLESLTTDRLPLLADAVRASWTPKMSTDACWAKC